MKTFRIEFEPFSVLVEADPLGYTNVIAVFDEKGRLCDHVEADEIIENCISHAAIDRAMAKNMRALQ